MTYQNTYKTAPLAPKACDRVKPTTVKVMEQTKKIKKTTKAFIWPVAGSIVAIIMAVLACALIPVAASDVTTLMIGGASLGALLTYFVYCIVHRNDPRETRTNPSWLFRYANKTVLIYMGVYWATSFLYQYFTGLKPYLTASFAGRASILNVSTPLLIAVFGVLLPTVYELFVGHKIHSKLLNKISVGTTKAAHFLLSLLFSFLLGGDLIISAVIAFMIVRTYYEYRHVTYTAALSGTHNILTILLAKGIITTGPWHFVVAYVVTLVLYLWSKKLTENYLM